MNLRQELVTQIQDLKRLLLQGQNEQQYLRNKDVKRLFGCSDSKLESMRKSGKLKFSKMQGTIYYKKDDVYELLHALPPQA
jgi:hypothetical protein